MTDYLSDLTLAQKLADIADAISLPRFRAMDLEISAKPDLTPVTDADRAVEQAIRSELLVRRPDDAILGEEFGQSGASTRRWIIDPIDGTVNFVRGVPVWATLIALSVAGKPLVSVVSAPAMGLRWWAAKGLGSFARGIDRKIRQLQVSKVPSLEDASISYNNLQLWQRSGYLNRLLELTDKVYRTRAYGDFWSYMLLAEGALDAVAEHDLQLYDIAALVPIVEQAGGRFGDIAGELSESSSSVLASNSLLHDKLTEHFARAEN